MENEKVSIELTREECNFICACIMLSQMKLSKIDDSGALGDLAMQVCEKLYPHVDNTNIMLAVPVFGLFNARERLAREGGQDDGE